MGLYYDKTYKKIIQDDRQMDMIDPRRYIRHESIGPCNCPKCKKEPKQTDLVKDYSFPDIQKKLKIGEK